MKLISLLEFTLSKNEFFIYEHSAENIRMYANFLNQPLTLGMFVCEVPEPELQTHENRADYCDEWVSQYQQAKERILFEGFEVINPDEHKIKTLSGTSFITNKKEEINIAFKKDWEEDWCFEYETIEDLVKYNLTLTKSAINQIM